MCVADHGDVDVGPTIHLFLGDDDLSGGIKENYREEIKGNARLLNLVSKECSLQ